MKEATYLTENSVSVLTVTDGANCRTAYANSPAGRAAVQEEHPEIAAEIFAVWGELPTVSDELVTQPTPEERLAALEAIIDAQAEALAELGVTV